MAHIKCHPLAIDPLCETSNRPTLLDNPNSVSKASTSPPIDMYLPLPKDPCRPSPCGLFSTCHVAGERPVCACLPDYMGAPPNCKPECRTSAECPSDRACINQRCRDPCPGTCGYNARCRCTNHSPICSCYDGYTGDPFHQCVPERSRLSRIVSLVSVSSKSCHRTCRTSTCTRSHCATQPLRAIAMWPELPVPGVE